MRLIVEVGPVPIRCSRIVKAGSVDVDLAEWRQVGSDDGRVRVNPASWYGRHSAATYGRSFAGSAVTDVETNLGVLHGEWELSVSDPSIPDSAGTYWICLQVYNDLTLMNSRT